MDRYLSWRRIYLPQIPVALKNYRLEHVRNSLRTSNAEYGQYYSNPELSYDSYIRPSDVRAHMYKQRHTSHSPYSGRVLGQNGQYYISDDGLPYNSGSLLQKRHRNPENSLLARNNPPEREDSFHLPDIKHKYLFQAEQKEMIKPQRQFSPRMLPDIHELDLTFMLKDGSQVTISAIPHWTNHEATHM